MSTKHDTIQKTVTNLSTQVNSNEQTDELLKKINELENVVFGSEDHSLYENNPNYGVMDTLKAISEKMDAMREEYVSLIGQYVENSTPRLNKNTLDDYEARIQNIESKVQQLESKPKFNVQVQNSVPLTKDNLNKLQLDKTKK